MQGMSSDRTRAVRYTENDKRGNIFSQEVRYRATKTGILQKTKTCNNSQAPDFWPSRVDKKHLQKSSSAPIEKYERREPPCTTFPLQRRHGMCTHIQKQSVAYVEVFGGSEKTSETRTPTPTQGTAERKCKKGAIACFRCAITSLLELRGNILKHHCREIVHHGRPHRPNRRIF